MTGPVDTKLEPMPQDVEDLLDGERKALVVPPFGAEQVVLASVMATVQAGAAVAAVAAVAAGAGGASSGAAGTATGAAASGAVQASLAAKVVSGAVIFLFGGLAGAGGHAMYASHFAPPTPAPIVQIVQVPVPAAPVAAAPAAPAVVAPAAPAVSPPVAAAPLPRPRIPIPVPVAAERTYDTALAAERGVLEVARTALSRGQADAAIAELEKHARLYPAGQLAEEREALWVQALVTAGRNAEARAKGKQFTVRHPKSMLLPAVQATLESIP
ncbi:MAG TPA: hypothetical protein VGK67_31460 [Myxococcales bacterium]|jgi:hypothetical protein